MNSRRRFRTVLLITSAGWFLFALDRLVVVTALPAIRTDLGADVDALEWTANAYTLAFAVLLLTGAALGDRFGRRRMLAIGIALFTVGSAAAALAPTVGLLIAARAVQGAGGAVFMPLTLTILSAEAAPSQRGTALGIWGGIGGLGAFLGPLLGGALAAGPGWRWIFWINVPLGLLLVPAVLRRLPESRGPNGRLDLPGVVLGGLGLLALATALVRASSVGWTGWQTSGTLTSGGLALLVFGCWERHTDTPIVPLRFFRHRAFAAATVASLHFYAALFGGLFLLTQLLQVGLGSDPLQAGLQTLPMAGVPLVLAPVAGVLCDRIGPRPLMLAATALEAAAFGRIALEAHPGMAYRELVVPFLMIGAGSALFLAPLPAVTLGAVRPPEQGKASGITTTGREIAAVLGVAVLTSILSAQHGFETPDRLVTGLAPTLWTAAGLAAAAFVAVLALPVARRSAVAAPVTRHTPVTCLPRPSDPPELSEAA